jgi:hypothetical protein
MVRIGLRCSTDQLLRSGYVIMFRSSKKINCNNAYFFFHSFRLFHADPRKYIKRIYHALEKSSGLIRMLQILSIQQIEETY